jgi:hypothetical protein
MGAQLNITAHMEPLYVSTLSSDPSDLSDQEWEILAPLTRIMDTQSVKTTSVGGVREYDRAKKLSGRKLALTYSGIRIRGGRDRHGRTAMRLTEATSGCRVTARSEHPDDRNRSAAYNELVATGVGTQCDSSPVA